MALSLKNSNVEQLAREVAKMTGESITETIQKSIQERKDRLIKQKRRDFSMEKIREILDRVDALPVLDPRSPDEIIGFDENGLPA